MNQRLPTPLALLASWRAGRSCQDCGRRHAATLEGLMCSCCGDSGLLPTAFFIAYCCRLSLARSLARSLSLTLLFLLSLRSPEGRHLHSLSTCFFQRSPLVFPISLEHTRAHTYTSLSFCLRVLSFRRRFLPPLHLPLLSSSSLSSPLAFHTLCAISNVECARFKTADVC